MPANVQNVSFTSPAALIAPDLVAEQARIQRQQDLAAALRKQSLEDIPSNGGRISATQGLAKMLNAFVSSRMYRKADEAQAGLSRNYASAIRGLITGNSGSPAAGGGGAPPAPGATVAGPAAGMSPPAAATLVSGDPNVAAANAGDANYGSGGVDDDGTLTPPAPAISSPTQPGAQAMPASSLPAAQPSRGGPLALTGNADTDMSLYMLDQGEYVKGVISAHAPTEMAKTVQQAQAALARGDLATANALLGQVQKDNYIAPLDGRPGTVVRDPLNPSHIVAVNPQSIEGANPVIGPNGEWTGGYSAAPGAADAIRANSSARSTGAAEGDVMQVFDPATRQMVYVRKADLLGPGSAAPGGAPSIPFGGGNNSAPAAGGGRISSLFGGAPGGSSATPSGPAARGNAAGPSLGTTTAADTAAKNSADQFNSIIGGAQGSQDRAFTIGKIGDLSKGLPTGYGATAINDLKSGANSILGAVGIGPAFSNDQIAKVQEIQKLASTVAQQQSASLGGNGATDAKLSAAFASLPDASKAPQAIAEITTLLQGNEKAIQGKAVAAAQWQQSHTADSFPAFSVAWQKAYDPRIYQWMAQGPAAVKRGLAGLPAGERRALIEKSSQLHALGAL